MNEPTHGPSPKAGLSPAVVASLRDTLKRWVAEDGANDSLLGAALHAVASDARDRGIRAEELLVTLKTTWLEVGGHPNAPHSPASNHKRLDELVTACIKAYYA